MDLTRRTVLASGAVAAAGGATAAEQPREKGPLVWMNMDQKELDDAYDQAVYAPNQPQLGKRRNANSKLVWERLGPPRRFAYGPTEIEGLDVWTTKKPNAPVMVFIHGGYWQALDESWFSFVAPPLLARGVSVAIPTYDLAPQVGLDRIVEQMRMAVEAVAARTDAKPVVTGHSAGGHLSACLLSEGRARAAVAIDSNSAAASSLTSARR